MEDDRNRLMNPLKAGWNLILEGILDLDKGTRLLEENHRAIHQGLDELHKNLQQLSRYRHNLNRRLEAIKREVDKLQLQAVNASGPEKNNLDQGILRLEEEGYSIQIEIENIENKLKRIRSLEPESNPG